MESYGASERLRKARCGHRREVQRLYVVDAWVTEMRGRLSVGVAHRAPPAAPIKTEDNNCARG